MSETSIQASERRIDLTGLTRGAIAGVLAAGMILSSSTAAYAAADPTTNWKPRYVTLKHPHLAMATLSHQAVTGGTVPFWTSNITSPLDGLTYTTSMVGTSPYDATKVNTTISYVPIVARIHFPGGVVLDPTVHSTCDYVPLTTRFFNSPLFTPVNFITYNVNVSTGVVGGTQLMSAYQRANFWSSVKGSQYGVTLAPARAPIIVDITAPAGSSVVSLTATCGTQHRAAKLGEIDINAYDAIINSLIATYATPTQLPIVLSYNVVLTDAGGCCILGYHNAVPVAAGTQTYAIGSIIDPGIFSGVADVTVWSHELGEWLDDPFVQASVTGGGADDLTPPWGHVGQVSGCQNNLENGDPLSGTSFGLTTNGYGYHYQDLAYHDWFYRTPSSAPGGYYSLKGTFRSVQGVC